MKKDENMHSFQYTKEEKIILEELLTRYERSKQYREGASAQRVQFAFSSCERITSKINSPEMKNSFLEALESLKQRGYLDYTWVKYEQGNLVDKVYLIDDVKQIDEVGKLIGRVSKKEQVETLLEQIRSTSFADPAIQMFFDEQRHYLEEKKQVPAIFFRLHKDSEDSEEVVKNNQNLLLFLAGISGNHEEQLERVLSARLFGDSKYFEKVLRSKSISILKKVETLKTGERLSDDEMLAEWGVFKWPEILEFCGPLSVMLDDGKRIHYESQIYGAYINASTIRHIEQVQVGSVQKILLIENKANYTWYLQNCRKEEELVLYHGGFFSPVKGHWFRLIKQAVALHSSAGDTYSQTVAAVSIFHWGDIDLGGFRMFHRLKQEIFPTVIPFKMDKQTMLSNQDRCQPLPSDRYREELMALLSQPDYEIFHKVITFMLQNNLRLEQENLIY